MNDDDTPFLQASGTPVHQPQPVKQGSFLDSLRSQKSYVAPIKLQESGSFAYKGTIADRKGTLAISKKTGAIIMIISAFAYSLLTCAVFWASKRGLNAGYSIIFRSVMQFIFSFFSIWKKKQFKLSIFKELKAEYDKMSTKIRVIVFLKALDDTCVISCYFIALKWVDVGDAVAILSIYPVFCSIAAFFILKEPMKLIHIFGLSLCMVGVAFICQPAFIFEHINTPKLKTKHNSSDAATGTPLIIGYCLVITTALVIPGAFIACRVANTAPKEFLMLTPAVTQTIGGFILFFTLYSNQQRNIINFNYMDWLCLLGVGAVGYIARYTVTVGSKVLPSGLASLLRSSEIAVAYIWQLIIFDNAPSIYTIIGAIIVLIAITIISVEKIRAEEQKKKKHFSRLPSINEDSEAVVNDSFKHPVSLPKEEYFSLSQVM